MIALADLMGYIWISLLIAGTITELWILMWNAAPVVLCYKVVEMAEALTVCLMFR